jgi:hypothetical protein
MAKKKYTLSELQITKRLNEGRGSGAGSSYTPWHYVHEVPSAGRSQRVYSHLTKRVHHLLSDLEYTVFLMLDANPITTDIREQFPLLREDTLAIARNNGIRHPKDGSVNKVMSSDFLVSTKDKNQSLFAIQVKYKNAYEDARTTEKLEIEKRYWASKNIPWFIVTEQEINKVVKENVDWLYGVKGWHDESVDVGLIDTFNAMQIYFAENSSSSAISLCQRFDAAYQLELGQSLLDVRRMCAARLIDFDLYKPFRALKASEMRFVESNEVSEVIHVAS